MRLFLSLLLSIIIGQYACADELKKISLEFSTKDYVLSGSTKDGNYINSNRQEHICLSDTTLPALPYTIVNVKTLGSQDYVGVTMTNSIVHFADNVLLRHNPVSRTTDSAPSSAQLINTVSYAKKKYPDNNVIYSGTSDYGEYKIVSFLVSPWIYDAEKGTLDLMTSIDLTIELAEKPLFTTSSRQNDYSLNEFTNALAVNASEFPDIQLPTGLRMLNSLDYEYVVVTTNALKSYFMPLVKWKTQKGVRAKVITIEEITNQYSDSTIQLKIKRCLYDYYNNHGLEYVLLGGDDTVVPVQGCYCSVDGTSDIIPCDNFYACFSGDFAWNADGDGVTGEDGDGVDFSPSIYISRAPVRSANDVTAFVNKTLNYEKSPNANGWNNNILMCGNKLWTYCTNNPITSDAQAKSEFIYTYYIDPYWSGSRNRFYDTYTDFGGSSFNLDCDNLQSKLSNGYTFVDMVSHGEKAYWEPEVYPAYNWYYASTLTNSCPTIITTSACNTNAFDSQSYDPCLSEAFIRNPNNSVVAYLGSSRVGWDVEGESLGPSTYHTAIFYKKLMNSPLSRKNWAYIVAMAKAYVIGLNASIPSSRWLQYSLNPIGDPEMPIFCNTPITFGQPLITMANSHTFTVNTGVSGCTICIMSSDNNGLTDYRVFNNVQTVTVNNFYHNLSVCITKRGYVPKIINMSPSVSYIQNMHIGTDVNYEAATVEVGTNVTNQIPTGNVVIQNCDVMISADETTLSPTTEVKAGASLTITNR